MTRATRAVAKRPPPRLVTVTLEKGDYAGWSATARADFPVAWLAELQSGDIFRILPVLDRIVVEHNLPNADDQLAERMADVDPYDGMTTMAAAIFDAIGNLPNR